MSDINTANSTKRRTRDYPLSRGLRAGLVGGIVAAVGNLIIYLIALAILGDALVVPTLPDGAIEPLSPINVALLSFIPGLTAGLLLWLLNRSTSEPFQIMLGISVSFLLFSFTAPLGLPSIPDMTRVALAAMHVIAAVAILGLLLRSWRK